MTIRTRRAPGTGLWGRGNSRRDQKKGKARKGSRVAEDWVKEMWEGRADLRSHRTNQHVAIPWDRDEEFLRLVKGRHSAGMDAKDV